MKIRREFVAWAAIAMAALLGLMIILRLQYRNTQNRFAIAVTPKPAEGRAVFRDKGCVACHHRGGGQIAPPLHGSAATLAQLVTAMWNHAPRMYEAMSRAKLPYPTLSYDETGQLLAFLYLAGYSDEPGDPARGKELFQSKNCARCHAPEGSGGNAPPVRVLAARADSPIAWTQALWNHGSDMESSMQRLNVAWPHFQANDLRDLFAYARQEAGGSDAEVSVPSADPDRGWQVFQSKYCINCHALRNSSGVVSVSDPPQRPSGPVLGADARLPRTFSQFGEAMLNHFPDMDRAMRRVGQQPATFEAQEMTDLAVFLYSLHYQEPSGSPHVGASVFTWRGCADCHGAGAEGTPRGPALRGRGQTYTAVRLAQNLWRHGARMYEQSRKAGQPWPQLQESDVGDLLSFLNTRVEPRP